MNHLYSKPLTTHFPKVISFTLILIVFSPQTHSLTFKDKYKVFFNGREIATLQRSVDTDDKVTFRFSENIMQHPPQTSPGGYITTNDIESSINLGEVNRHYSEHWEYSNSVRSFEDMLLHFLPAYEFNFQQQSRSDGSTDSHDDIEENIELGNLSMCNLLAKLYNLAVYIIRIASENANEIIHECCANAIGRDRLEFISDCQKKYNLIRNNINRHLLTNNYYLERARVIKKHTSSKKHNHQYTEGSPDKVIDTILQAVINFECAVRRGPNKYDRYIYFDTTTLNDAAEATFYLRMHVVDQEGFMTDCNVPLQPVHNEHLIDDNFSTTYFPYAFIRRLIGRDKTSSTLVHHTFSDESNNRYEYRGVDYVEYSIYLNEKCHEERTTDSKSEFHKKHNAAPRPRRQHTSGPIRPDITVNEDSHGDRELPPVCNGPIRPNIIVNEDSNGDRELLVCDFAYGSGEGGVELCNFQADSSRHSFYEGAACIEPHEEHQGCEMDCKSPPSITDRSSILQTMINALARSHNRNPESIRYLFFLGETMAHYFNELVSQPSQGATALEEIAVFDPLSSTNRNIIGAYQVFSYNEQANVIIQRDPAGDPSPSHVRTEYQLSEDRTQVIRITVTDSNPNLTRQGQHEQVLIFDATGFDEPFDVSEEETAGFETSNDETSTPISPFTSAPLNATVEDATESDEFRPSLENLLRELPFYPGAKQ